MYTNNIFQFLVSLTDGFILSQQTSIFAGVILCTNKIMFQAVKDILGVYQ